MESSNLQLHGKVALITGGTSGIGAETARVFHAAGASVIVTGQSEASLERARRELPDGVVVVRADARKVADSADLSETVRSRFGGLDALFLNAGVAKLAPFEFTDEAMYDDQMDVNVKGVVFTLLKLLPLLRPDASVIVNTSLAAHRGTPNMSIYAATKGAVSSLVRTLAVELAPKKIRVNAISPSLIHTDIQKKFGLPEDVRRGAEASYSARIPLGRFGNASEVASLALFLSSPAASYITGTEIGVDGGFAVA